jgi:hypothetical protein
MNRTPGEKMEFDRSESVFKDRYGNVIPEERLFTTYRVELHRIIRNNFTAVDLSLLERSSTAAKAFVQQYQIWRSLFKRTYWTYYMSNYDATDVVFMAQNTKDFLDALSEKPGNVRTYWKRFYEFLSNKILKMKTGTSLLPLTENTDKLLAMDEERRLGLPLVSYTIYTPDVSTTGPGALIGYIVGNYNFSVMTTEVAKMQRFRPGFDVKEYVEKHRRAIAIRVGNDNNSLVFAETVPAKSLRRSDFELREQQKNRSDLYFLSADGQIILGLWERGSTEYGIWYYFWKNKQTAKLVSANLSHKFYI